MSRPTVTAPPELTLPAVAELLAQFRAAPTGLHRSVSMGLCIG